MVEIPASFPSFNLILFVLSSITQGWYFCFDIIKQRNSPFKPLSLYRPLWVESAGGRDKEVLPHSLQGGEARGQQREQQQTGEQQPWSPKEAPGKGGEVSTGSAEGTDGSKSTLFLVVQTKISFWMFNRDRA